MMSISIRDYTPSDEQQWVRCRVLAFLDSAYFDDVQRAKEQYESPSIELVAEADTRIVGFLDVEYDEEPGDICQGGTGRSGMIWHLGVHPDFRRRGIATLLLEEARQRAIAQGLSYLEAWTRDDAWVQTGYEAAGFERKMSYLHVYLDGEEASGHLTPTTDVPGLRPVAAFAHYVGEEAEAMCARFRRVHECVQYCVTAGVVGEL